MTFLDFFNIISISSTVIVVITTIAGIIGWIMGICPAIYRLGNGLSKRKIAIFAKGDNTMSLKNLLIDSRLFRQKNIFEITKKEDIGKAEEASLYLVQWNDWSDDISKILSMKNDKCAMIVYAPNDGERVPSNQMQELDSKRYVTVANFRGRLINDIIISMMTTKL